MAAAGIGIARKIPGVGTVLGAHVVRTWVTQLRAWGIARLSRGYAAEASSLKTLMKETGIVRWADFWHYGRTQISLQMRLFAEQVYSDMGPPWSDLITGFGPITKSIRSEATTATKRERDKRDRQKTIKRNKQRSSNWSSSYRTGGR